ncbi:putative membrane protein [Nocardioidaceae bacterium Broad-1]|nr:putative membrane protein [Nocardioidaceae bacterium Broad-1]
MSIAAAPQAPALRPDRASEMTEPPFAPLPFLLPVPMAPRLPFVVLVSMLLVGGVVGLLVFNTSMQQSAFQEQRLQEQATTLAAREQALDGELKKMEDPHKIAAKAKNLGMVVPQNAAMLRVPEAKIEGEAAPADRSATPPLHPKVAKPYSVLVAEQKAAEAAAAKKKAAELAEKKRAQEAAEKQAAEEQQRTSSGDAR